jgi:hypothetical protein
LFSEGATGQKLLGKVTEGSPGFPQKVGDLIQQALQTE